jgi:hypothetical protein
MTLAARDGSPSFDSRARDHGVQFKVFNPAKSVRDWVESLSPVLNCEIAVPATRWNGRLMQRIATDWLLRSLITLRSKLLNGRELNRSPRCSKSPIACGKGW